MSWFDRADDVAAPPALTTAAIYARTDCPECGSSVGVHRISDHIFCTACQSTSAIPMSFWHGLCFRLAEKFPGSKVALSLNAMLMPELPLYVRFEAQVPSCGGCHAPLPWVPPGTNAVMACPRCGTATELVAAPSWITSQFPDIAQFFVPAALPETPPTGKVISFGCTECGGKLSLQPGMPRILDCRYCQASIFLPNDLWFAVNPIQKRRAWWVAMTR